MKHRIEKIIVSIFPPFLYRWIGYWYGRIQHKTSYSQYGEDLIIIQHLKTIRKTTGTYLDIGCFHPTFISNTHLLHQMGWDGYVVDLDQYKLDSFKRKRGARCTDICGAIINNPQLHGEAVPVYKFNRMWSEIDTLDEDVANHKQATTGWSYGVDHVRCIDIQNLLQSLPHIDVINIDIEGLDDIVIKGIDFKIASPEIIIFEDNTSYGGSADIVEYLATHGYSHLFTAGGSVGFYKLSSIKN